MLGAENRLRVWEPSSLDLRRLEIKTTKEFLLTEHSGRKKGRSAVHTHSMQQARGLLYTWMWGTSFLKMYIKHFVTTFLPECFGLTLFLPSGTFNQLDSSDINWRTYYVLAAQ